MRNPVRWACTGLTAMALILAPSAANAGEAADDLPILEANPGLSQEVIDSLPEVVLQSDVLVDDSYEPGMPIIYPDGTPVEGQSAATTFAAAFCGGTVYGPPGTWGATSQGSCGVFGHPGYKRGYTWAAANVSIFTTGCVQGRGYNASQNAQWYSLSCGSIGSGTVPWGNVLAKPATRALSQGTPFGFTASWQ